MNMKVKLAIMVLSSVIALYAIVGGLLPRYGVVASNDPYSQMTIFHEVLSRIVEDYVDQPDFEKVRLGALRGLAEGLDPYSAYLTPEQVRRYQAKTTSAPAESGIVASKVAGWVYVVSVVKDSAADKAGVRPGDVIEYINNKATRDMSLYDSEEMLLGEIGKEVEFKLFRAGRSETVKFKLDRMDVPEPSGRLVSPGVGYLNIHGFSKGQAGKVLTLLTHLMDEGAKGIIIDLRQTTPGRLDEAVSVANLFIGEGTLAKVIGREGREIQSYEAKPERRVFKGEVVALIDRSTIGTAEVVAAAIAEHKAGEVVGEKTFGGGGDLELFRLRDGGGMLITTKKYASPTGKPFMGTTSASSGVMPTVEARAAAGEDVPTPEQLEEEGVVPEEPGAPAQTKPTEDIPLKKAIQLLRSTQ